MILLVNSGQSYASPTAATGYGYHPTRCYLEVTTAAARQGKWFAGPVTGDNSSAPAWLPVSIKATQTGGGINGRDLTKTTTGNLYLPPATETLVYDLDGNLQSDGRWTYTWDAENRLVVMQTHPIAIAAGIPIKRVEYQYDADSRRIARAEPVWDSANATFQPDPAPTRYLWKHWTLLAEFTLEASLPKIIKTNHAALENKPSDFPRVKDAIRDFKKNTKPARTLQIKWTNKDDNLAFTTSGDQALFLGNISLKLEGGFIIKNDCTWEFKGLLKSFDDWYDFNASTHRGSLGESLTTLGRNSPGKPYWIEIRGSKRLTETGSMSSHSDLGGGGGRGWY